MRLSKLSLASALLLNFAGGFASTVCAQTAASHFSVTFLGTLGGKGSDALAVNSAGQVVGLSQNAQGNNHAFLYSDGKMRDLGTLGGATSEAHGINAAGQIVGVADLKKVVHGDVVHHAFLYDHGVMQDLGTLGGDSSWAGGINTSGLIVGESDVTALRHTDMGDFIDKYAFQYSNGKMQAIVTSHSMAECVNDAGMTAGAAFFRVEPANSDDLILRAANFDKGKIHDLGLPPNLVSIAKAVNASGQIAGSGNTVEPQTGVRPRYHAFLYTLGTSQDLGTLGGEASRALGISNSGMVVGTADTASGQSHAFLFDGEKMLDLSTLVDHAALVAAHCDSLTSATAINDRGQIAGFAKDTKGNDMAFLLTPVDAKPTTGTP